MESMQKPTTNQKITALDDSLIQQLQVSPTCTYCKWFKSFRVCRAFNYIPDDIWNYENMHRTPHDGDHGIQFEPM